MVLSIRRFRAHFGSKCSVQFIEDERKFAKTFAISPLRLGDLKIDSVISDGSKENDARNVNVYHGRHVLTEHCVVIKQVDLDSEETFDKVIQESKMLQKLKHPNIVPFLSMVVSEQKLYTILSVADYGSIDLWRSPVGLPEIAIALVIKDVLTALVYLHRQGIVHRAICGEHILINSNGTCLLTGFKYSISMMKDGKFHSSIFDYPKNVNVKLLNFIAPEILRQNMHGYTTKSDIYSLGILCCELANGCVPFDEVNPTEMLCDKLTHNYPRPLDSTCNEIQNFPTENLSPEMLLKVNTYRSRTFSQAFQQFTVEQCLHFDWRKRPTAAELLNSAFLKQTKKSHKKLLEILESSQSAAEHRTCTETAQPTPTTTSSNNNNNNNNPSSSSSSKESIHCQPQPHHHQHHQHSLDPSTSQCGSSHLDVEWNFD